MGHSLTDPIREYKRTEIFPAECLSARSDNAGEWLLYDTNLKT